MAKIDRRARIQEDAAFYRDSGQAMEQKHIVTAKQARFSARLFNLGSMVAACVPVLIPLWFAGSIFVYAMVAHHPDLRVREYNRLAGYRFYGIVGLFVMVLNFTGELKKWLGGPMNMWLAVWAVMFLVIVPAGILAYIKAGREDWQDFEVEAHHHA